MKGLEAVRESETSREEKCGERERERVLERVVLKEDEEGVPCFIDKNEFGPNSNELLVLHDWYCSL